MSEKALSESKELTPRQSLGAIIFIVVLFGWALTDPLGYWEGQERLAEEQEAERQAQIESWNLFADGNSCEFIGMDGKSEQHLCSIEYEGDSYSAIVLYHANSSHEWKVTSLTQEG